MKIKQYSYTVNESSLSRIWQKTHDKKQFAIIGSKDKDTHEDRSSELLNMIKNVQKKYKIGWVPLEGTYTYDNGDVDIEKSYLIDNISFTDAMNIMMAINQESIIWKDSNYFGFIDYKGNRDGDLSTDDSNRNFSSDAVMQYGSRLVRSNTNNMKPFIFEMYSVHPEHYKSSIRHLGGVKTNKVLEFSTLCKWE